MSGITHVDRGGTGRDLVVLLHGLAATGAVWHRVASRVAQQGRRWVAPDLRGHGGSASDGPFWIGQHAADIAALIADEDRAHVHLLGHSFGGALAAMLGKRPFAAASARGRLGVKTDWPETDVAFSHALAAKPARRFATRGEAEERYLKAAGLHGLVGADAPEAARGVRAVGDAWETTIAPGVFACAGPSTEDILRAVRCPLRLATGTEDPMTNAATLRAIDPGTVFLPGLPHNAHVVAPDSVAALLE
ncbi:MAG: alpha/beta hydrolase [Paracoccaceae bacterium]